MARHKTAAEETREDEETGGSGAGEISKMEAVRRALAEGYDKPAEGVQYIKSQFKIDIPTTVFSTYKSQIKAKEGRAGGSSRGRTAEGDPVEAAKAVKALVERYGADTVRGLVDLFDE